MSCRFTELLIDAVEPRVAALVSDAMPVVTQSPRTDRESPTLAGSCTEKPPSTMMSARADKLDPSRDGEFTDNIPQITAEPPTLAVLRVTAGPSTDRDEVPAMGPLMDTALARHVLSAMVRAPSTVAS